MGVILHTGQSCVHVNVLSGMKVIHEIWMLWCWTTHMVGQPVVAILVQLCGSFSFSLPPPPLGICIKN